MNRQQRRKAQKANIIDTFDANTTFRLKYDLKAPGGPLRGDHPSQVAGVLEARDEADLLRGILVKLLEVYGYIPHDRAVSGILGEVLNPLPRRLRGNIAFAIIEGLGLAIGMDEEDVCDDPKCGAVFEQSVHPDPPADTPEDDLPLMLDTTVHAPECHVHRETDAEARPLRPAAYKQEEVVLVNNPRHYEPLNNKAIDPETGDVTAVVPETGGEDGESSVSTVDADENEEGRAPVNPSLDYLPDEPFIVNEEDEDVRRTGEDTGTDRGDSAAAEDAIAGEPGAGGPSGSGSGEAAPEAV